MLRFVHRFNPALGPITLVPKPSGMVEMRNAQDEWIGARDWPANAIRLLQRNGYVLVGVAS